MALSLFGTVAALLISACAVALSRRRYMNAQINRRLLELESDILSTQNALEKTLSEFKKLRAKLNMRERRAKENGKTPADETPAEWKKRMRTELAMKNFGGK